jgi:hypothetical protein
MVVISFTVCFEDPYWIGLIEQSSNGHIGIGKIVFGAEPSNAEIVEFVLKKLSSVPLHEVAEVDFLGRPQRSVKSIRNNNRTKRSLEVYKSALCAAKIERKVADRETVKRDAAEKFQRNQLKKKQKRQGH